MTRLLLDDKATEIIQGAADMMVVGASAAAGSSAIVQTLVSGSLAQLWGMINAMQILVYMRVFNIQFPANANLVSKNIIIVATFDLPFINTDTMLQFANLDLNE